MATPTSTPSIETEQSVLLHLEFVVPDDDGVLWPKDTWQDTSLEVPMSCTMHSLEQKVKEVVTHNLQRDETLLMTLHDPNIDGLLTFSIGTLQSAYGQPFLRLGQSEQKLETVSYFFQDPSIPGSAINVTVNVDLDPRPPRGLHQPPAKFSNLNVKLTSAEDRVVEKRLISPRHDAWEYVYVRLGTVSSSMSDEMDLDIDSGFEDSSKSIEDTEVGVGDDVAEKDIDTTWSKTGSIAQIEALIGYYRKGHTQRSFDLSIAKLLIWDFGDYCIGDRARWWEPHQFSKGDHHMSKYTGVRFHSHLHKRVQKHLQKSESEPGSGVPFMPFYTHNTYNAKEYRLGGIPTSTNVLIRFVNNFTTAARGLGLKGELKLPWSVQYQFGEDETPASITAYLTEELGQRQDQEVIEDALESQEYKYKVNSHLPFEKPLADTRKLQLWVLPQSAEINKMFKFPNEHSTSTQHLYDFLLPNKVMKVDHRLYMEAHVMPKA